MPKVKVTAEVVISYRLDEADEVQFVDEIARAVEDACADLKLNRYCTSNGRVKADFKFIRSK